eukprot:TRINITY_DN751_c0_g1_i5.p1 TRINITY_DN751_c0_g1~~TRINITY_DN751_c0_g1_i5.p1  ORF type:complete len:126 (-),score=10.94 TRINITY_DN751_c0_g1_i5:148-525(-)
MEGSAEWKAEGPVVVIAEVFVFCWRRKAMPYWYFCCCPPRTHTVSILTPTSPYRDLLVESFTFCSIDTINSIVGAPLFSEADLRSKEKRFLGTSACACSFTLSLALWFPPSPRPSPFPPLHPVGC